MSATKSLKEMVEERLSQEYLKSYQMQILKELGLIGLRMEMPRRGRYQVWDGTDLIADRIKHRKQALALIKLLGEKNGSS